MPKPINEDKTKAAETHKEPEYTVEELLDTPFVFEGVPADCIAAALHMAELQKTTKRKAKEIVTQFIKREVK